MLKVRRSGIILALDVLERARAIKIVEEVADYIDAVKVGYPLILSVGLDIISELKGFEKPIIADFKIADVPHVSSEICRIATGAGADYAIVQGFLGRDVVEACSKAAEIFVVCDMSHPGALDFISPQSEEVARLAKEYAVGIVAPATRPQTIKKLREIVGNLIIIAPGVKAQGAEVGSAINAGADFEIVGRAIYNSPNPRSEAEGLYNQLKEGEKDE
ncbi:MAG: orotidine-5'-phosphate decarboxylase [Candidatus Hydrothermarchaeales archaeon]